MYPALQGLLIIVLGVIVCVGYFFFSNQLLDKVILPAKAIGTAQAKRRHLIALCFFVFLPALLIAYASIPFEASVATVLRIVISCMLLYALYRMACFVFPRNSLTLGDTINRANQVRPWLFLFPALFVLGLYLVYPVFETLRLSMLQRIGGSEYQWVGFTNYLNMFGEEKFHEAMLNNILWLIIVPAMSTSFGLLIAQLTDRISWGNAAKSMVFMPMAISFVGASVIWKLVYDTRPVEQEQIGVLNALYMAFGGDAPQTWLTIVPWNSFLLMVVLIWIQTGFAMVILSAALRGIPEETVEAAIVDGASPLQIFFKIKVPQIMGTIVVVWTTITITVLKVFDIVFAMTNGQWQTQVLANYMFDKLFRANDWGMGSAAAMIIMLMITPILVWNVYNARKEMR